jgi:transcriptional regulator with XRE-family HTH domain
VSSLRPARTRLQLVADRRSVELRRSLAAEIRRLRTDSGLSQTAVARAAGISRAHLSAIEAGDDGGSVGTIARLAAVLGAHLHARLYPNSGPAIHDRIQARVGEAVVRILDARWRVFPEVPVRAPTRGRIDLVLFDAEARLAVATEIESGLRRIEQLIGWHRLKAEALPSSPIWPELARDGPPAIHRLLVVRATRETRAVATSLEVTLRAAYPAAEDELRAALAGRSPWPGDCVMWVSVRGTNVSFKPRHGTLGRHNG